MKENKKYCYCDSNEVYVIGRDAKLQYLSTNEFMDMFSCPIYATKDVTAKLILAQEEDTKK